MGPSQPRGCMAADSARQGRPGCAPLHSALAAPSVGDFSCLGGPAPRPAPPPAPPLPRTRCPPLQPPVPRSPRGDPPRVASAPERVWSLQGQPLRCQQSAGGARSVSTLRFPLDRSVAARASRGGGDPSLILATPDRSLRLPDPRRAARVHSPSSRLLSAPRGSSDSQSSALALRKLELTPITSLEVAGTAGPVNPRDRADPLLDLSLRWPEPGALGVAFSCEPELRPGPSSRRPLEEQPQAPEARSPGMYVYVITRRQHTDIGYLCGGIQSPKERTNEYEHKIKSSVPTVSEVLTMMLKLR
nr:ena/VASP-like protein [Dasypus novemcinctus]